MALAAVGTQAINRRKAKLTKLGPGLVQHRSFDRDAPGSVGRLLRATLRRSQLLPAARGRRRVPASLTWYESGYDGAPANAGLGPQVNWLSLTRGKGHLWCGE